MCIYKDKEKDVEGTHQTEDSGYLLEGRWGWGGEQEDCSLLNYILIKGRSI